jgi:hypothetical protein
MSIKEVLALDQYGKGGGLVEGCLCVNFRSSSANRHIRSGMPSCFLI